MEETKKCKSCGDILPLSAFRLTKAGGRTDTCKECIADARNNSLKLNRLGGGQSFAAPFYDADFDGKQPVEVIQLMSRAKRWLESRGYEITLKGKYTITKDVKF